MGLSVDPDTGFQFETRDVSIPKGLELAVFEAPAKRAGVIEINYSVASRDIQAALAGSVVRVYASTGGLEIEVKRATWPSALGAGAANSGPFRGRLLRYSGRAEQYRVTVTRPTAAPNAPTEIALATLGYCGWGIETNPDDGATESSQAARHSKWIKQARFTAAAVLAQRTIPPYGTAMPDDVIYAGTIGVSHSLYLRQVSAVACVDGEAWVQVYDRPILPYGSTTDPASYLTTIAGVAGNSIVPVFSALVAKKGDTVGFDWRDPHRGSHRNDGLLLTGDAVLAFSSTPHRYTAAASADVLVTAEIRNE